MKATLEFNLYEEEQAHYDALNGWRFKGVISDLFGWINQQHDYNPDANKDALESFRKAIVKLLDENEVKLQ